MWRADDLLSAGCSHVRDLRRSESPYRFCEKIFTRQRCLGRRDPRPCAREDDGPMTVGTNTSRSRSRERKERPRSGDDSGVVHDGAPPALSRHEKQRYNAIQPMELPVTRSMAGGSSTGQSGGCFESPAAWPVGHKNPTVYDSIMEDRFWDSRDRSLDADINYRSSIYISGGGTSSHEGSRCSEDPDATPVTRLVDPTSTGRSAAQVQGSVPWLDNLHNNIFAYLLARSFDGDKVVLKDNELASPWRSFKNYRTLCLLVFGHRPTACFVPCSKASLTFRGEPRIPRRNIHTSLMIYRGPPITLSQSSAEFSHNSRCMDTMYPGRSTGILGDRPSFWCFVSP